MLLRLYSGKRSHELALIHIGQCLKGTANMGLILKPIEVTKFKLDGCVDSGFMASLVRNILTIPIMSEIELGMSSS